MSLILLGILNSQVSGAAGGSYELIESNILTSSASSVTFSSIPQDYKHLQIRATVRSASPSNTDNLNVKVNNSTTGYISHRLFGNGLSVSSELNPDTAKWEFNFFPGNGATTGAYKPIILDILDYANTSKNTTARALHGVIEANEPIRRINLDSGLWANTAAITSVSFQMGSNILSGSRFSLYGIRG